MSSSTSIQRTLALGLSASVAVVALVLGLVALLLSENIMRDYARAGLEDDAVSVLAALQRQPDNTLGLDASALLPAWQMPLSGRYFTVNAAGQTFRSRSLWDGELPQPGQAGLMTGFIAGPDEQQLLVLRADFRRLGTDVVIVVATDMAPLLARFRDIGIVLLGVTVIALLVLLLMQRYWMRHALAPLERTQQQLSELQQGQRDLLQTDAPQELQPLIGEINRLLQYSRESMKRSRHALGNLGHALKSPLGVLFVLADKADGELKPQMLAQLEQIQRRVSRELGRARASGEARFGAAFTPHEDLPLLIDTLKRAHQRELQLAWAAPQGQLPFEQDDMLELLGNLLDNACKWARNRI
ncbi:MAG: ATP-binding protein, partial [Pseudomonadota bacterium]|nr:ATP-binding protein [Pseudomonadota bacterium]